MTECHQIQKRTLDEAKLLLAGTPSKIAEARKQGAVSTTIGSEPHRLARSAANLEAELRNWRACFESWIVSQRSYMRALAGWLRRCIRSDPGPGSPRRTTTGAPPIFGICTQWSRFLDGIHEAPVLEGLDFFAAGVGSLYARQLREDSRRPPGGSKRFGGGSVGNLAVVEVGGVAEEAVPTPEKMAEVAIRVLCAGMSVAMSSLAEFAIGSAEGYANLVKQCDPGEAGM